MKHSQQRVRAAACPGGQKKSAHASPGFARARRLQQLKVPKRIISA